MKMKQGEMWPLVEERWQPPEAEKQGMDSPLETRERGLPADTLTSNLWSPELWENTFLLFKQPRWWSCGTAAPRDRVYWPWVLASTVTSVWSQTQFVLNLCFFIYKNDNIGVRCIVHSVCHPVILPEMLVLWVKSNLVVEVAISISTNRVRFSS